MGEHTPSLPFWSHHGAINLKIYQNTINMRMSKIQYYSTNAKTNSTNERYLNLQEQNTYDFKSWAMTQKKGKVSRTGYLDSLTYFCLVAADNWSWDNLIYIVLWVYGCFQIDSCNNDSRNFQQWLWSRNRYILGTVNNYLRFAPADLFQANQRNVIWLSWQIIQQINSMQNHKYYQMRQRLYPLSGWTGHKFGNREPGRSLYFPFD